MAKITIEVDRKTCIASAACEALSPEYFKVIDGAARIVKKGSKQSIEKDTIIAEVDEEKLKELKEAAASCPVNAIHLINQETKEKYY